MLPSDLTKATLENRRVSSYSVTEGTLYMICLSTPLLKCLEEKEAMSDMTEMYEGIAR